MTHGLPKLGYKGVETGRIQVAARALGVGTAAFNDALRYSHERESFGKPVWQHQCRSARPRRTCLAGTATRPSSMWSAPSATPR